MSGKLKAKRVGHRQVLTQLLREVEGGLGRQTRQYSVNELSTLHDLIQKEKIIISELDDQIVEVIDEHDIVKDIEDASRYSYDAAMALTRLMKQIQKSKTGTVTNFQMYNDHMRCKNCSFELNKMNRYCPECGHKQEEIPEIICGSKTLDGMLCRQILNPSAKFCLDCGPKTDTGQREQTDDGITDSSDDYVGANANNEKELIEYYKEKDLLLEGEIKEPGNHHRGNKMKEKNYFSTLQAYLKKGPAQLLEEFRHRLREGDNAVVKFGVTGRSAVGKSSFVNLLLNIKSAKTGSGDTTMTVTEYKHSKTDRFTISDMPGFGTAAMPKDKFLKIVDLRKYDFFIIFIESVFMEDDTWIANKLLSLEVPFCFVRTKLDVYLDTEEAKAYDQTTKAVSALRAKLQQTMAENESLKDAKLFLISNNPDNIFRGDLYSLISEIAELLPGAKSDALMFLLPVFSPNVIEMKLKQFKERSMMFRVLRTIQVKLFPNYSYEFMKEEIERCFQAFNLEKYCVNDVPNLQHVLCQRKSLPPKEDERWKDMSYLYENFDILGKDALKVFNHYKGDAPDSEKKAF